jgi:two-component system response regulator YesN
LFSACLNDYFSIEFGKNIASLYTSKDKLTKILLEITNPEKLKYFCVQLLDRIANHCVMSNARSHNRLIYHAIQFIHSDLQNTTLNFVADKLGISPVYLSMLFKEKTKMNFKDYVTHLKLRQAKILLKEPAAKVSMISRKIGYTDVKYFCKIFKKFIGVSPSIYKLSSISTTENIDTGIPVPTDQI